jgi:hypothetical protein
VDLYIHSLTRLHGVVPFYTTPYMFCQCTTETNELQTTQPTCVSIIKLAAEVDKRLLQSFGTTSPEDVSAASAAQTERWFKISVVRRAAKSGLHITVAVPAASQPLRRIQQYFKKS